MVRILIDTEHRRDFDIFHENRGLNKLADAMIDDGVEFAIMSEDFLTEVKALSPRSVLILYVPSKEFTEDEISTLQDFLAEGGGILILGEWGNMDNSSNTINTFLSRLGLKEYFNFDRVVDEYNIALKKLGEGEKDHIVVREFSEHPITHGIKQVGYYSGCSIDVPEDKAVMWSSEMSFGDLDGDLELDNVEIFGEKTLAFWEKVGDGRLVGVGDSSLVQNEYIDMYDNKKLIRNTILWLMKSI